MHKMISIKEAKTKKELLESIKFPFTLYKDNPYWVPPLISDELETFDKTKNPVFQTAEAYFYLAYKDNKIVGRVALLLIGMKSIINKKESTIRLV